MNCSRTGPRPTVLLPLLAALALAQPARPASPEDGGTAAPVPGWALAPGSKLWLEGDSTLHKYRADAKGFFVTAMLPPSGPPPTSLQALAAVAGSTSAELRLPVRELRSGEGGLDSNMWKALDAEHHPVIVFEMTTLRQAPGGDGTQWDVSGNLSVAGTVRPLMVRVILHADADGLHLSGSCGLKMSDFGVKPPVLFAGAIKTADAVTVRFAITLRATAR